jgi:flagellar hook-basal body complex protein FliE
MAASQRTFELESQVSQVSSHFDELTGKSKEIMDDLFLFASSYLILCFILDLEAYEDKISSDERDVLQPERDALREELKKLEVLGKTSGVTPSVFFSQLDELLDKNKALFNVSPLIYRYKTQKINFDFIEVQHNILLYLRDISGVAGSYLQNIASIEDKIDNFSQQIKDFESEYKRLQAVLDSYILVLKSYDRNISSLATQESVLNLSTGFQEFKQKFGDSDAMTGFAGNVNRHFEDVNNKIDVTKNELKKLILGPDQDGKGGLQASIIWIEGSVKEMRKLRSHFIPAFINVAVFLVAVLGAFASGTSFINQQVTYILKAEFDKQGGIQSQITNLNTAQGNINKAQRKNDELLRKMDTAQKKNDELLRKIATQLKVELN